jgi:hypothetical protein
MILFSFMLMVNGKREIGDTLRQPMTSGFRRSHFEGLSESIVSGLRSRAPFSCLGGRMVDPIVCPVSQ